MRLTYLTNLTSLLFVAALFTSCGGSTMSAGGNNFIKKRERKDASADKDADAKDPKVVTGAYLSCDISSKDADKSGNDAVGCSMHNSSGQKIQPNAENKLAFYRRVDGSPYQKPTLTNTASGHQAVFAVSRSETQKSKYIATYANRYGIDEVVCETIPCRSTVKLGQVPSYLQLAADAVWRLDDGVVGPAADFFGFIDTGNYCRNGSIMMGKSPAANASGFIDLLNRIGGGLTSIEPLGQLYAEVTRFKRNALNSGKFYEVGDGCIVIPLKRTGASFHADGMTRQGRKIDTSFFHLILKDTDSNRETVRDFVDDIR